MHFPTFIATAIACFALLTQLHAETPEIPTANPSPAPQVAWLGIYVDTVPSALRAQLGIGKSTGLIVDSVVQGSPAEVSGIQVYDVLLAFEDQRLFNRDQLHALVSEASPHSVANFLVVRGGKKSKITVTLGSRPAKPKKSSRWDELNVSKEIKDMLEGITKNPEIRAALSEAEGELAELIESISKSLPSEEEIKENIEDALEALKEEGARIRDIEILGKTNEAEDKSTEPRVMRRSRILSDATEVNYQDSHGAIEVTVNAKQKTVEVTDPAGAVVYSGPLNHDTLQALNRRDSERLKNLLRMHQIELAQAE